MNHLLSKSPFENEENEENEEEELEEETRLKKVSVKDFYYREIMCCSALPLLAAQENSNNLIIYSENHLPIRIADNCILFQVFRL